MKKQLGAIERVKKYVHFFIARQSVEEGCDDNELGITIHEIAEYLGWEEKLVYEDLRKLKKASAMGTSDTNMLVWGANEETKSWSEENEENEENEKRRWELAKENKLGFFFHMKYFDKMIALDKDEAAALSNLLRDYNLDSHNINDILFKEVISYHKLSGMQVENIKIILAAISYSYTISFVYNKKKYRDIYPLRLMYDSEENIYAIYAEYKNKACTFRLDKISEEIEYDSSKKKDKLSSVEKEMLEIAPYIWGFQCKKEDYLGKVKVYFLNDANVWKQVEQSLEFRKEKKLYKEDKYLIYEDTVYGKEAFKTWILGFGRSAVVAEPKILQDEIIELMNKRIDYFSK